MTTYVCPGCGARNTPPINPSPGYPPVCSHKAKGRALKPMNMEPVQ